MRSLACLFLAIGIVAASGYAVSAQCDRSTLSPIRCGYYDEGYQDGARDAQAGQTNDYRRYRNKFERQYEDHYRDGYNAGYTSVPTYGRWTMAQRGAYDMGYNLGSSDRFASRPRSAEQYQSRSALGERPYFFQGYMDGYEGVPRRYDFQIGHAPGGPGYPGTGTPSGTATWAGRVDNRANIILHGSTLRAVDLTSSGLSTTQQFVNGVLPRRATNVSVRKIDGRGTATVIQQPSRFNNFEAVVQISDPRGGDDNYRIEISWHSTNIIEDYQSGRVMWRGRADQTVNIYVAGSEVWAEVVSGNALQNVRFDLNGYLARRPGSVNVRKREGRGTVSIQQQPSASNDYVAVIQIFDPQGGADDYEVEISW